MYFMAAVQLLSVVIALCAGAAVALGQTAAPAAPADLQSCLQETGDYLTRGRTVTYVIGHHQHLRPAAALRNLRQRLRRARHLARPHRHDARPGRQRRRGAADLHHAGEGRRRNRPGVARLQGAVTASLARGRLRTVRRRNPSRCVSS